MIPTGYPVNTWGDFDFVLLPIWWIRHRLLHQGEYSVFVAKERRTFGGLYKVLEQRRGMELEEARRVATEIAEQLSR